jgi:hypothetical protein
LAGYFLYCQKRSVDSFVSLDHVGPVQLSCNEFVTFLSHLCQQIFGLCSVKTNIFKP